MKFLDASRIVKEFGGGPSLPVLVAGSGTLDPLTLYLRAAGALAGRQVEVSNLPFNTLQQHLVAAPEPAGAEVFLLMPWDLFAEADWRSGVSSSTGAMAALRERATATVARLASRSAHVVYVNAPTAPLSSLPAADARLRGWAEGAMREIGAEVMGPECFSYGSYLSSGCPIASAHLAAVASRLLAPLLIPPAVPAKLLITDLDNVMWAGVIGEDGVDGIACGSEGRGHAHFVYQTFLAKLKSEGTLLAAVSRNDPEIALAPLRTGRTFLRESDFVAVLASYHAKSAQILALSERLNLGLDSFVFVDDNPVELAEVAASLPAVRRVPFPAATEQHVTMFAELSRHFAREVVTSEDRDRTELYRRRVEGMAPSELRGADLTAFLRELEMQIEIRDRSRGDRERAVQLINKTNQFNLNGRRVTDDEVARILDSGGRLYAVSASDRTGSHGEILACLVDSTGSVVSLVMSCRVFQRRIEHAFIAWLARSTSQPLRFAFEGTPRNEPMAHFLADRAFKAGADGTFGLDGARFVEDHSASLELFRVVAPGSTARDAVGEERLIHESPGVAG